MTLAITLMICGVVSVCIGMFLGFSSLRDFSRSMMDLDSEVKSPFSFSFLVAMIFDLLGGVSFIVGLVILIITLVKA